MDLKITGRRGDAPAAPASDDKAPRDVYEKLAIRSEDLVEDRYHRLRLIKWWDQALLKRSVVIVAGAGALGNEVLKNLALLGPGPHDRLRLRRNRDLEPHPLGSFSPR
jgi:hypothetical protein